MTAPPSPECRVELRTAPGFSKSFQLDVLHYGLILHWRVSNGAETREDIEYCALVDDKGSPCELTGVEPDVERQKLERGEETSLDHVLVRESPFRISIAKTAPFGRPTLQRAFLVALARSRPVSANLGLKVHAVIGGREQVLDCQDAGANPILLWTNGEWSDNVRPSIPTEVGKLDEYVEGLRATAERETSRREVEDRRKREAARPPPPQPPRPAPVLTDIATIVVRQPSRPTPSPPEPSTVLPPSPPAVPIEPKQQESSTRAGVTVVVLGAVAAAAWWASQRETEPPTPQPQRATLTPAAQTASLPRPTIVEEPRIPVGNSVVSRDTLYQNEFPNHLAAVNSMLKAAKEGDLALFDERAEWLRTNRPARKWPSADGKARSELNGHLDSMINRAKDQNDKIALERAVQISEKFLLTHFGYSVAHLNLSIAKIGLDDPKGALPPAFHSIVFNPDGANGYVALAVALARVGDVASSTAAFCTVLRKVKYSDKTVTFFASIARGEHFPYTEVAQAIRGTELMCPKEKWGTDYPTS